MGNKNRRRKEHGKEKNLIIKSNKGLSIVMSKFSTGLAFSIIVILLAYFHYKHKEHLLKTKLNETLSSLVRAEAKVTVNPGIKVALGFGSCQDVIVQSKHVLRDNPPPIPEHLFSINTREELLKVFAYFYRHGAAAERYIANSTLFNEVVKIAEKSSSVRYVIGGNAAVMASRFVKEGCNVLLGAQMSKSLSRAFPKSVIISGPEIIKDDIHLLLEYPAGELWGPYRTPRANRFIIHNDHQNPLLSSLELFSAQMETFNPNLLVVSGLQMMDNFPIKPEKLKERLMKVQMLMKKVPEKSNIHFEMASFSNEALMKDLVDIIIPFTSSLGMNEQELPNLFQIMKYGNVSLVAEPYPRIAVILDQMRDVFRFLQKTEETDGRRKLTRLHIHTLAFHALMVDKKSLWKNTMSALAKSVLTANRHTCGSDKIDINKARIIMDESFTIGQSGNFKRIPFDTNRPIACWEEDNVEICVAPVLVCTEVLQTGGGGDNISSAGLVLQI